MNSIRNLLKKSDIILGIRSDYWKIQRMLWGKTSSKALDRYLKSSPVKKLQIGAGPIALPGWLGTDLRPTDTIAFLDATKPFPIESNTFDYIHCEHMIEHITWFDGLDMLRECRRILKPHGTIRIATPDLCVFANLYHSSKGSFAEEYMKFITDFYLQGVPDYRAGFVINSLFYRWGHKFVYDGELLEMALQMAGFLDIKRFEPGESDDPNLRNIEMHGKIGNYREDANEFETMVFEAKSPE